MSELAAVCRGALGAGGWRDVGGLDGEGRSVATRTASLRTADRRHWRKETLAGPVVLIALALAGMAAGVAFRVKPFLYLGSGFVLIAVISMVWHAQRAIDQTWPWWAFGITVGLALLAALMTLEKNKPKLRQLASHLASWEA